ncbi:MAG: phage holin family protein [Sphingomicrobium sp.]
MADGGIDEGDEKPAARLFARLIDDGRAYARAAFNLVRASVEARADAARKPALFGAIALLFVIAAVTTLCVMVAMALATLVGPLAGGLIVSLVTFGIAAIFAYLAKRELDARQ